MEDENKTTENKITVKEAKKLCLSAFTTGFLLAVLITMLAFLAPDLYTRFVKHEIPPREKMTMIYNIMKKYYIDDIDKDDMYEGMYTGMAAMPTDVYSYYMSAEEARKYNERTDGNYVGIGVQIQGDTKTKELEIVDVYKSSPAYEAGIKEGDILKSVSGVAVGAENMDEAVEMVRGPENTSVDMVIYRPDEDRDIDVTCFRKQVDMTTVYGRMLDGKTGYIQITGFEGVTPEQFSNVLDELTKSGMIKTVAGEEFDVTRRQSQATKLNDGDEVLCCGMIEPEDTLVMQSKDHYFLRIPADTIPEKKKPAVGVRGMRLSPKDEMKAIFLLHAGDNTEAEVRGKKIALKNLHIGNRDTKGVKR